MAAAPVPDTTLLERFLLEVVEPDAMGVVAVGVEAVEGEAEPMKVGPPESSTSDGGGALGSLSRCERDMGAPVSKMEWW